MYLDPFVVGHNGVGSRNECVFRHRCCLPPALQTVPGSRGVEVGGVRVLSCVVGM